MNKSIIAVLAIMLAVPASLSAKPFSRSLTVKGSFNSLRSAGNIEVEYTPSNTFAAVIEAEYKEDLDKVKATLSGGTLTITTVGEHHEDIKVKLSAPGISSFEASGNSEIEVEGNISGINVTLKTEGNASIDIDRNVNASKLTLDTSGNSHIDIDGSAASTEIHATTIGNSNIKISDLDANAVIVDSNENSQFSCKAITTRKLSAVGKSNAIRKLGGKASWVEYDASGNSQIKAGTLVADGGKATSAGNSHIRAAVRGLQQSSQGNSSISNK